MRGCQNLSHRASLLLFLALSAVHRCCSFMHSPTFRRHHHSWLQASASATASPTYSSELTESMATSINGHDVRLICQDTKTPVQESGDSPADLTGFKLWPVASNTFDALVKAVLPELRRRQSVGDRPLRVLELGSGAGLSGICVALSEFNAQVVLTEGNVDCLQLLQQNIGLNSAALQGRAAGQELLWGDQEHISALKRRQVALVRGATDAFAVPAESTTTMQRGQETQEEDEYSAMQRALLSLAQQNGQLLDEGLCADEDEECRLNDDEGPLFDLVFGSDLMYEPRAFSALIATLKAACAGSPDTLVVLGYQQRSPDEKRFFDYLSRDFDWALERPEGAAWNMVIVRCSLKQPAVSR